MTGSDQPRPWAPFWPRVGASLVDWLILGVIGYLIGALAFAPLAALGEWGRFIGLGLSLAYFGVLSSGVGGARTLGMRLFRLRVVAESGGSLGLPASLGRALVLVIPFLLNGLFLSDADTIAGRLAGVALLTGVFGLGLAQIYLLLFNRPSRRLPHDLMFGSSVVVAGREPVAIRTSAFHARAAFAIVIAVFLLAAAAPALMANWAPRSLARLVPVQKAVSALPEVIAVGVSDNTTTYATLRAGSQTVRTLEVTARLRSWPSDPTAEIDRIGRAVLASYRLDPGQRLQVRLACAFNLGIASGSKGYSARYP